MGAAFDARTLLLSKSNTASMSTTRCGICTCSSAARAACCWLSSCSSACSLGATVRRHVFVSFAAVQARCREPGTPLRMSARAVRRYPGPSAAKTCCTQPRAPPGSQHRRGSLTACMRPWHRQAAAAGSAARSDCAPPADSTAARTAAAPRAKRTASSGGSALDSSRQPRHSASTTRCSRASALPPPNSCQSGSMHTRRWPKRPAVSQ